MISIYQNLGMRVCPHAGNQERKGEKPRMSENGPGRAAPPRAPSLYRRVAAALREEIGDRLHPGDTVATESELECRFGVSRATIRRAIDLLVQEGRLVRRQGSGTYVTALTITEELGVLHGWAESMRRQGLEPRTVDCEILQVLPPPWVSAALCLDPAFPEPVLRLQRLRYANDAPLCLMVDYLRQRYAPNLLEVGLAGESLYETLHTRYGLDLARVEDTVTARGASVLEASLLGVPAGAPVLLVQRITFLADDQAIDAATVVARADRYAYRVAGRTAPVETSHRF